VTVEKPYEIEHIPKHLHAVFDGKVPPAVSGKTTQERETNFLSRALAALALHKLTGCTPAEAAASLVDGGGEVLAKIGDELNFWARTWRRRHGTPVVPAVVDDGDADAEEEEVEDDYESEVEDEVTA
jgi:hypothetical protein